MAARWDAVVVGAGPAGTLSAERLVARGLRVALLDAGPLLAPPPGQQARAPEVDRGLWAWRAKGRGFDWYRVRAVGGRALLWGGWSYRLADVALRRAGFPYGAATLARHYAQAERATGVVEGALDPRYRALAASLGLAVLPRRGALGPAGYPWTPLDSAVARRARTHAVALRVEHARGRATGVAVLDLETGAERTLAARAVVLAASPIETARIVLESALGVGAAGVGRGLVDHMVASYVLLEPAPAPSDEGRGPFPGGALVEGPANVGPGTEQAYPGGFSVELNGPVPLDALGLERFVPGDEVARWRATQVHALGEVFPHRGRYVDLDPAARDGMGRRQPRVHTAWSRADHRLAADLRAACVAVADALAVPGSRVIPFVDPLLPGAGHEAGTCRMGGRGEDTPCDALGRLRALENVWVADASALPTAGDRHPTLTVAAHALRAADAAARRLGR